MPSPVLVYELDALIHRLRPSRRPGAVSGFLAPGVAAWTLDEVPAALRQLVEDVKLILLTAILAINDRLDDEALRDDALLGAVVAAGPPPWPTDQTAGWPPDLQATAALWSRAEALARRLPNARAWWGWFAFDLQGIHRTFSYVRLLQRGSSAAAPEAQVILPNDFGMLACLPLDLMACAPLDPHALGPIRACAAWAERITRLENDLLGCAVEAAQGDASIAANGYGQMVDRRAEVRAAAFAAWRELHAAAASVKGLDGAQFARNLSKLLRVQRRHYAPESHAPPHLGARALATASSGPMNRLASPSCAEIDRLDGLFAAHRPWRTAGIVRGLFAPALAGWRLSGVSTASADAVWAINMQMATAITLFDDRVDRAALRDPALLRLVLDAGPPPWPARILRHLQADLLAVSALWAELLDRASALPRWAEVEPWLALDRVSLVQAFRYAALLQEGGPASLREAAVHLAQDYGMVAFAMVDLAASPSFDPAELGPLRDVLLACQRSVRLHNHLLTVEKESHEGDHSNALLGFGRRSPTLAAAAVHAELAGLRAELTEGAAALQSVDGGRLVAGLDVVIACHADYYDRMRAGAVVEAGAADLALGLGAAPASGRGGMLPAQRR
jgi:hypothetical protein